MSPSDEPAILSYEPVVRQERKYRFAESISISILYLYLLYDGMMQYAVERLNSAVGKAVANHAEVRGSIPSTDVGKEPDREIFSPVSDASV